MTTPRTYYRRNLPHYHPTDATFHVVFRLEGSLPRNVIDELMIEREKEEKIIASTKVGKQKRDAWRAHHQAYFEKFDALLDGDTTGPRWLADNRIAEIVAGAIHYRDTKEYDLFAFTIMPNHVHVVFALNRSGSSVQGNRPARTVYTSQHAWPANEGRRASSTVVSDILENLKWYSALKCNRVLGRTGHFWQHESYDRVIRDGGELERTIWYVLYNPVKAGIADTWEQWRWTYVKPGML